MKRFVTLGALAALVAAGALGTAARTQDAPPSDPAATAPPAAASPVPPGGFPNLIEAIRGTKGCLGIELARTMSGKQVIFAWFEDKQAVKRFYYGDVHQGLADQFFPDRSPDFRPLAEVADDSGPLMVIASITMSDQAQFSETSLPISQIAIEIYQPVTGGLFLGGRFAPDAVKVRDMTDYTPPAD